jgi:hypothetical protein
MIDLPRLRGEPARGSAQVAQENPEFPQPAAGGGLTAEAEPPTLMLDADITFLTSSLLQEVQETAVVSVDETMASNSSPQELQINS